MALIVPASSAMEKGRYEEIVSKTVHQVLSSDEPDVAALIADQEELMSIGVDACREYAAAHADDAKLLDLVIANADAMKTMTLDEIEEQWHDYGFLESQGVDAEAYEHFAPVISLMDAVVHPATAIIAIRKYESTRDRDDLMQVKDELSEVLEHLKYIP